MRLAAEVRDHDAGAAAGAAAARARCGSTACSLIARESSRFARVGASRPRAHAIIAPPRGRRSDSSAAARAARPRPELAAIAAIVVLAGALRLWSLAKVPSDPFYDAAVRSMPLSLHNFLLGAYEPGGSLAVDKPPLDLWLQVLSTQLFGFGSVALKLPPALAGTAAVGGALRRRAARARRRRRAWPRRSRSRCCRSRVLTARSDTMDSVAMLLSVVALWLLVRFAQDRPLALVLPRRRGDGARLQRQAVRGPGRAAGADAVRRARSAASGACVRLGVSAAVFVVVALVVADADARLPDSSAVRDRLDRRQRLERRVRLQRLRPRSPAPSTQPALTAAARRRASCKPANNSEVARSAVPIGAPALLRLFEHDGPLSGLRLGFVLLARARARRARAGLVDRAAARRPTTASSARSQPRCCCGSRSASCSTARWRGCTRATPRASRRPSRRPPGSASPGCCATGSGSACVTVAGALALVLYGRYLLGGSSARLAAHGDRRDRRRRRARCRRDARARVPLLAAGLALAALALPLAGRRAA